MFYGTKEMGSCCQTKPEDLSSILGAHMVERDNWLLQPLSDLHACTVQTCTPAHKMKREMWKYLRVS